MAAEIDQPQSEPEYQGGAQAEQRDASAPGFQQQRNLARAPSCARRLISSRGDGYACKEQESAEDVREQREAGHRTLRTSASNVLTAAVAEPPRHLHAPRSAAAASPPLSAGD